MLPPVKKAFSVGLLAIAVGACADGPSGTSTTRGAFSPKGETRMPSHSTSASAELHALFDAEWENDLREYPTNALSLGDRRYDDAWDEAGLAAIARREAHERDVLAKIKTIDPSSLSTDDRLS